MSLHHITNMILSGRPEQWSIFQSDGMAIVVFSPTMEWGWALKILTITIDGSWQDQPLTAMFFQWFFQFWGSMNKSREIFRLSGMDFPITPSSWCQKLLTLLKIVKNGQKLSTIVKIVIIVKMLVRLCFYITLIKCLKGHRCLGSLFECQVVKS